MSSKRTLSESEENNDQHHIATSFCLFLCLTIKTEMIIKKRKYSI